MLGTRDTLWEDIEEFGTLTLSDACLHKRLINDVPSLAEMLEKEAEIKNGQKEEGTVSTLARLDPGLYATTALIKKDRNFRLYPWPVPLFCLLVQTLKGGGGDRISCYGQWDQRPSSLEQWKPLVAGFSRRRQKGGKPGVVRCFERWGRQSPGTRRELGRQMRRSWSAWRCTGGVRQR